MDTKYGQAFMCLSFVSDSEGHDAKAAWHWYRKLQKLGLPEQQSKAVIILETSMTWLTRLIKGPANPNRQAYTEDGQNSLDARNAV